MLVEDREVALGENELGLVSHNGDLVSNIGVLEELDKGGGIETSNNNHIKVGLCSRDGRLLLASTRHPLGS